MSSLQVKIPEKLLPLFVGDYDVIGAHGGRGSGKTMTFASMLCYKVLELDSLGHKGVVMCCREFMVSLRYSSMSEIKYAIDQCDFLSANFEYGAKYIKTKSGGIEFIFTGLNSNLNSIKSTSQILICWVEEAESVSKTAWNKLRPTLRPKKPTDYPPKLWITWNPESEDSAVEQFRKSTNPRIKIIECNWRDNPFFPDYLNQLRLEYQSNDPATYGHIWEGEYLVMSDAQVLGGAWEEYEFEPDWTFGSPLFGGDFGFSQDPSTLIKAYIKDGYLYIEQEAYAQGVELEDMPAFYDQMPQSRTHVIYADCSRPETISYIKSKGFRIRACDKWSGSVQDGIAHLRGAYKKIRIHPRCKHTIRECRLYSYKVDKKTERITADIVDANNHTIDAIRYALNDKIKRNGGSF